MWPNPIAETCTASTGAQASPWAGTSASAELRPVMHATEGGRPRSTAHGKSRGRVPARPRPTACREVGDHGGQRPRPRQGPQALAGMCAFDDYKEAVQTCVRFRPTNSRVKNAFCPLR